LSEFDLARPNHFRAEMLPMTFALGAIQGVDGFGYFALSSQSWQSAINFTRTRATTPASLVLMPSLAHAFKSGFLPEGDRVAELSMDPRTITATKPVPLRLSSDSQIPAPNRPLDYEKSMEPALDLIWSRGSTKIEFPEPGEALKYEIFEPKSGDTNYLKWETNQGLFTIDAPFFQGATGFFGDNEFIKLRDVSFSSKMPFGAFTLVALDGKSLDFSERMLLSVMSSETNTAYYTTGEDTQTIRSIGTAPLLIDNLLGRISFHRPDANRLRYTALDINGNRVTDAAVGATLNLLPSTFYYLIEKP